MTKKALRPFLLLAAASAIIITILLTHIIQSDLDDANVNKIENKN